MSKINEIEVYQAFVRAKINKKPTITKLADSFNISRTALYNIVNGIDNGNYQKITKCTQKAKMGCIWEYKYKTRLKVIPKNRKKENVALLVELIKDMSDEGFNISQISDYLKKDRSTILHHLNN